FFPFASGHDQRLHRRRHRPRSEQRRRLRPAHARTHGPLHRHGRRHRHQPPQSRTHRPRRHHHGSRRSHLGTHHPRSRQTLLPTLLRGHPNSRRPARRRR